MDGVKIYDINNRCTTYVTQKEYETVGTTIDCDFICNAVYKNGAWIDIENMTE